MKECKHCKTPHKMRGNECRVCKDGIFRYKMNRLDILAMHKLQDGNCVLCKTPISMFMGSSGGHVDHCHKTGKVRGILCQKCNVSVGALENTRIDNVTAILHYIGYLEEQKQPVA